MTNDESNPNDRMTVCRHSEPPRFGVIRTFGHSDIDSSFEFRHSNFAVPATKDGHALKTREYRLAQNSCLTPHPLPLTPSYFAPFGASADRYFRPTATER